MELRVRKKDFKGHAKRLWVGDLVVFDPLIYKWRKATWGDAIACDKMNGLISEPVRRGKKILVTNRVYIECPISCLRPDATYYFK